MIDSGTRAFMLSSSCKKPPMSTSRSTKPRRPPTPTYWRRPGARRHGLARTNKRRMGGLEPSADWSLHIMTLRCAEPRSRKDCPCGHGAAATAYQAVELHIALQCGSLGVRAVGRSLGDVLVLALIEVPALDRGVLKHPNPLALPTSPE